AQQRYGKLSRGTGQLVLRQPRILDLQPRLIPHGAAGKRPAAPEAHHPPARPPVLHELAPHEQPRQHVAQPHALPVTRPLLAELVEELGEIVILDEGLLLLPRLGHARPPEGHQASALRPRPLLPPAEG